MFKVDSQFPEFELETYFPTKNDTGTLGSNDFKGKWLVLFWYPADFTFVCPTELADLMRRYDEFGKLDAEIISVSTDTVYTHKGWIETEKLLSGIPFPMAADHSGKLARELGIYDESVGQAQRAVFIVDPKGILRSAEIVSDSIGRNASEILRIVKALKFTNEHAGKVCPASWDEGAPVIEKSIKIAGNVGAGMRDSTKSKPSKASKKK